MERGKGFMGWGLPTSSATIGGSLYTNVVQNVWVCSFLLPTARPRMLACCEEGRCATFHMLYKGKSIHPIPQILPGPKIAR